MSTLRLLVLPFFLVFIYNGETVQALYIFFFAIATDVADGYLARMLRVSSRFGAYLDSTIDFIFVFFASIVFCMKGFYPTFVPILLAFIFFQFLVTSRFVAGIYDPIGRHYGTLIYLGTVLTLLFPVISIFVSVGIAIASFATLFSRSLYILYFGKSRKS